MRKSVFWVRFTRKLVLYQYIADVWSGRWYSWQAKPCHVKITTVNTGKLCKKDWLGYPCPGHGAFCCKRIRTWQLFQQGMCTWMYLQRAYAYIEPKNLLKLFFFFCILTFHVNNWVESTSVRREGMENVEEKSSNIMAFFYGSLPSIKWTITSDACQCFSISEIYSCPYVCTHICT